jgi:hypothetical protein
MKSLVATAYDAAGNATNSTAVDVNVSNSVVVDTQAPVIVISNPFDGSQVTGMVGIKVSVSDNGDTTGIKQTLYIDGKAVASSSGTSLTYNWNARKASSGSHTIQAVARDAAGNTSIRSVTVKK